MSVIDRVIYLLSDEYWDKHGDPRIKDWPLYSGGLWRILFLMAVYLVLTRVILPKFMAKRPPYKLTKTILAYNVFMVIANFYFFCFCLYAIDFGRIFSDFTYPSLSDRSEYTLWILSQGWYIFLSRIIDLLDTVFFVLRKKESQVTMLHLYHHSMVPILGWISVNFNSMVPTIRLFLLLNTLIHTVMYGYYALSSLGPSVQKYLWWKKYITIIQLSQFVILGIYGTIVCFLQTGYPMELAPPFLAQPFIFFMMFLNFYRKSYRAENLNKQRKLN